MKRNLCPLIEEEGDASSAAMQFKVRSHISLCQRNAGIFTTSASRAVRPTPIPVAAKTKLATLGIDGGIEPGAALHCRPVYIAVPYIGGLDVLHARGDAGNGPGWCSLHHIPWVSDLPITSSLSRGFNARQ